MTFVDSFVFVRYLLFFYCKIASPLDPIQYFLNNGFNSLMEENEGTFVSNGYMGSLDYQLYNEALFEKVKDFNIFNFNSLDSDALDYKLHDNRDPSWFDGSVPYRYGDHDPLVTKVKF